MKITITEQMVREMTKRQEQGETADKVVLDKLAERKAERMSWLRPAFDSAFGI
jgi:hypothetical protein